LPEFQEKINQAGSDTQKLFNLFNEDSRISQYFKDLADNAQRYAYILENVNDEQAKLNLRQDIALAENSDDLEKQGLIKNAFSQINSNSSFTTDQKIRI
jgi:DNA-binding ferritin-like protein